MGKLVLIFSFRLTVGARGKHEYLKLLDFMLISVLCISFIVLFGMTSHMKEITLRGDISQNLHSN